MELVGCGMNPKKSSLALLKENWKMRGDLDRFARGPPAGGREVTGRYLLYIQHRNSVLYPEHFEKIHPMQ
eukprot:scaffold5365_cov92-Skeletonema_marinoi.AAC.2